MKALKKIVVLMMGCMLLISCNPDRDRNDRSEEERTKETEEASEVGERTSPSESDEESEDASDKKQESEDTQDEVDTSNTQVDNEQSNLTVLAWEEFDYQAYTEEIQDISNLQHATISVDGTVLYEEYFNSCLPTTDNNIFSVTKSITSMLIGIAIEEGHIESVDQKMSDIIDLSSYDVPDSFYDITIHHLLTMSSGIAWDNSQHVREFMRLKSTNKLLEYIFSKDATFEPGERFNYSDATAHLSAEVLYATTGMIPLDYANEKLFGPMGIEDVEWTLTSSGVNIGGSNIHLTCGDMIKLGHLFLGEGLYEGEQLVPKSWFDQATTYHMTLSNWSKVNGHYGYYFWLGDLEGYRVISGIGHGGQYIVAMPDLGFSVTAATIGGVSNNLANQQIIDVRNAIYNYLLPEMIDYREDL